MSAIRFIRKTLFSSSQAEFAAIIGVAQSSVSRWENGGPMTSEEMHKIRSAASERSIAWDDRYFFETPSDSLGLNPGLAPDEDAMSASWEDAASEVSP